MEQTAEAMTVCDVLRKLKFKLTSMHIVTAPGSYERALLELALSGATGDIDWCIAHLNGEHRKND